MQSDPKMPFDQHKRKIYNNADNYRNEIDAISAIKAIKSMWSKSRYLLRPTDTPQKQSVFVEFPYHNITNMQVLNEGFLSGVADIEFELIEGNASVGAILRHAGVLFSN